MWCFWGVKKKKKSTKKHPQDHPCYMAKLITVFKTMKCLKELPEFNTLIA